MGGKAPTGRITCFGAFGRATASSTHALEHASPGKATASASGNTLFRRSSSTRGAPRCPRLRTKPGSVSVGVHTRGWTREHGSRVRGRVQAQARVSVRGGTWDEVRERGRSSACGWESLWWEHSVGSGCFDSTDVNILPIKILLFAVKHASVLNFAIILSVKNQSGLLGISQHPLFNTDTQKPEKWLACTHHTGTGLTTPARPRTARRRPGRGQAAAQPR